MDRYGYLAAKNRDGEYDQWASDGLQEYFSKIGITNATLTIPKFQGLMNQYVALTESDKLKTENQPIAWRYAPIYPSKLPGMPKGIKPFGAVCMSAPENRNVDEFEGKEVSQSLIDEIQRGSQYSHLVMISQEEMLSSENNRTYLDHLFGMKLTSWKNLREQRTGRMNVNLDAYPEKTDPELISDDLRIFSAAVASDLFSEDEKSDNKKEHLVLIRAGKNTVFNDEAKELLKAIYAILPPQLAFELGFASYQDLNSIPELTKQLNIRIFVVPGNCDIYGKTSQFYRVYDLVDGYGKKQLYAGKKEDPLFRALWEMWKLPWSERHALYSVLFPADDARFHLKSHYLQQYDRFSAEISKYKAWDGKTPVIGKAEDIPQIAGMFPILCAIPAYRELVLRKIKKSQNVDVKVFACEEYGKSLAKGKEKQFPEILNRVTGFDDNFVQYACTTAIKAVDVRLKEDDALRIGEVAKLKVAHNDAMAAEQKKHADELEEQKNRFIDRERKQEYKHQQELAAKDDVITLKNEENTKLNRLLKHRDGQIQQKEGEIAEKDERIAELEKELGYADTGFLEEYLPCIICAVAGIIVTVLIFVILHTAGVLWKAEPIEQIVEQEPVIEQAEETPEAPEENREQEILDEEPVEEFDGPLYLALGDENYKSLISNRIGAFAVCSEPLELNMLPDDLHEQYTALATLQFYKNEGEAMSPYIIVMHKQAQESQTLEQSENSGDELPENNNQTGEDANTTSDVNGAPNDGKIDDASVADNQVAPNDVNTMAEADRDATIVSEQITGGIELTEDYCYLVVGKRALSNLAELDSILQLGGNETFDVLYIEDETSGLMPLNLSKCYEVMVNDGIATDKFDAFEKATYAFDALPESAVLQISTENIVIDVYPVEMQPTETENGSTSVVNGSYVLVWKTSAQEVQTEEKTDEDIDTSNEQNDNNQQSSEPSTQSDSQDGDASDSNVSAENSTENTESSINNDSSGSEVQSFIANSNDL